MILGWVFVRPIPLPTSGGGDTLENGTLSQRPNVSTWRSYLQRGDDSDMRLLPDGELDHDEGYVWSLGGHARAVSMASCGEVVAGSLSDNEAPDLSGKELLTSLDFWLLFTIMSLRE